MNKTTSEYIERLIVLGYSIKIAPDFVQVVRHDGTAVFEDCLISIRSPDDIDGEREICIRIPRKDFYKQIAVETIKLAFETAFRAFKL